MPCSQYNGYAYSVSLGSLVAQKLKCLPAMWETWVRSLGREDPLEKEMATQIGRDTSELQSQSQQLDH